MLAFLLLVALAAARETCFEERPPPPRLVASVRRTSEGTHNVTFDTAWRGGARVSGHASGLAFLTTTKAGTSRGDAIALREFDDGDPAWTVTLAADSFDYHSLVCHAASAALGDCAWGHALASAWQLGSDPLVELMASKTRVFGMLPRSAQERGDLFGWEGGGEETEALLRLAWASSSSCSLLRQSIEIAPRAPLEYDGVVTFAAAQIEEMPRTATAAELAAEAKALRSSGDGTAYVVRRATGTIYATADVNVPLTSALLVAVKDVLCGGDCEASLAESAAGEPRQSRRLKRTGREFRYAVEVKVAVESDDDVPPRIPRLTAALLNGRLTGGVVVRVAEGVPTVSVVFVRADQPLAPQLTPTSTSTDNVVRFQNVGKSTPTSTDAPVEFRTDDADLTPVIVIVIVGVLALAGCVCGWLWCRRRVRPSRSAGLRPLALPPSIQSHSA